MIAMGNMYFPVHKKQIGIVGYRCIRCNQNIMVNYHTEDPNAFEFALDTVRKDYDNHLDCCGDVWRNNILKATMVTEEDKNEL